MGKIEIMAIIVGLVEFAKRMGVHGRAALIASMALGVVLGILERITTQPPTEPAGWFEAVLYGLAYGLAASGLYDLGKRLSGLTE